MAHQAPPNWNQQMGSGTTTMQMWQGYPSYAAAVYAGQQYSSNPLAPTQPYYLPQGYGMAPQKQPVATATHTNTQSAPGGPYGMAGYATPTQPRYDMNGGYEGVRYGADGPPTKKKLTHAAAISSAAPGYHATSAPMTTSNNRSTPSSSANGHHGAGSSGAATAATSGNAEGSSGWPPSLVEYVTRCFQKYTDPEDVAILEKKMAEMVKLAKESNTIWSRDWSALPLPVITRPSADAAPRGGSNVQFSLSGGHQQKGSKSNLPATKLGAHTTSMSKFSTLDSSHKSSKKKQNLAADEEEDSEEKRLARAQRFKAPKTGPSPRPSSISTSWSTSYSDFSSDDYQDATSGAPLVGTSTALEKAYFRLIERPQASSVRPVPVLKQSLELMREKKAKGNVSWKTYLGEQLKSIRQDLVIQAVNDEFALEVYETNARWCLEYDDLPEFKRCLLRINEFYNHLDLSSSNQVEFATYNILYHLISEDFPSLNKELSLLPRETRSQASIRHAMKLAEAYMDNNWSLFFTLSKTNFFLEQHILQVASERLRFHALTSIFVSYRPNVPIEWLGNQVGLPNMKVAVTWFSEHGCVFSDASKTSLDAKESLKGLLEWESKNKPGK